jgi:hypothetical protein
MSVKTCEFLKLFLQIIYRLVLMRNHLNLGKCIQTQFFSTCFWFDNFLWWRGPGTTLTVKNFQMTLQHCNLQDHEHIDFCCVVRVVVRSFSSRGSYNFLVKSGCIDLVCAAYQPGISSDEQTEYLQLMRFPSHSGKNLHLTYVGWLVVLTAVWAASSLD